MAIAEKRKKESVVVRNRKGDHIVVVNGFCVF
jgi:hypothetical protein